MKRSNVSLESFWTRHSWLLSVLVAAVVSALGTLLDRLLVREGLPRRDMVIFSNMITGLVAAWFFHSLATHEKNRRELVRERMQTIAELNHHIRNALQVIKYWGGAQSNLNSLQLQLINSSVDRIEWALREVLPRYPDVPAKAGGVRQPEPYPSYLSSKPVDEILHQRKPTDQN